MGQVRYLGRKATGAIRFGSNTIVDGEIITVGDKVYELRAAGSAAAGHVLVAVGGTAALTAAALIAAINANKPTVPVTATVDPVENVTIRLAADAPGAQGNITLLEGVADAGVTVSAATLLGGDYGGKQFVESSVYVVTVLDVAALNIMIPLEVSNPRNLIVQYRKSTGEEHLSITDKAVLLSSPNFLKVFQAGATHLAAGDEIHYQVTNG